MNKYLFSLLTSLILLVSSTQAAIVNATWNVPTDVPVTASSYTASATR